MSIIFIYIANISFLFVVGYWFSQKSDASLRKHFWVAWFYKNVCGLLLGALFFQHYGAGDTISFYHQANEIAGHQLSDFVAEVSGSLDPSQPVRAIYFVRIVGILKYLTHADYWLLSLYFSTFSLMGSFYLVGKLSIWRKELKVAALIGFIYFPSVVFWSSGLLKESLVFGCLTLFVGVYISWLTNTKLRKRQFFIGLMSLIIIITLKYYIAAVLVPSMLYLVIYHLPNWKETRPSIWERTSYVAVMLLIPMAAFFTWLNPNLNFNQLWSVMQENHNLYLQIAPDGAVHTLSWFYNAWDILINVPYLWFSGIFRPMLGEDFSFPVIFSSLENSLLLTGTIITFYLCIKNKITWTPELLAVLLYISTLSIFLSYSTPNFGTLARFKVYYMPFVVLIIVYQLRSFLIFRKN